MVQDVPSGDRIEKLEELVFWQDAVRFELEEPLVKLDYRGVVAAIREVRRVVRYIAHPRDLVQEALNQQVIAFVYVARSHVICPQVVQRLLVVRVCVHRVFVVETDRERLLPQLSLVVLVDDMAEARLVRIPQRNGVIGHHVPQIRPIVLPIAQLFFFVLGKPLIGLEILVEELATSLELLVEVVAGER